MGHLTNVSLSMMRMTSLTAWIPSSAAARGSTFLPKVEPGARMWEKAYLVRRTRRREGTSEGGDVPKKRQAACVAVVRRAERRKGDDSLALHCL